MMTASPKHRIFLAVDPIDFRQGIPRIAGLCQQQFQQDPFSGHYFIFRNKRCTDIKIFYYDSQGFCLFQKRLSTGRFQNWPKEVTTLVSLTPAQLQVLLYNGDPSVARTAPAWQTLVSH